MKLEISIGTTEILAIWGAIVATTALVWNIIRGFQDRKKIKVETQLGYIKPGDPERTLFYAIVTNIGRRPVFITGWGGVREDKEKPNIRVFGTMIPSQQLPKMLQEGDYVILGTDDLSFFDKKVKRVHAWDSTGKYWKNSKKNMRQLLRQVKKELHNHPDKK
jgi:hypothetical protein